MSNFSRYSLRLVKEETHRYVSSRKIRSARDIAEICREVAELDQRPEENLVCFFLNTKNQINGFSIVSTGTLNASLIHPREVLKLAIMANANAIIIAHNHPSGDVEPSGADRQVTSMLNGACKLMQIDLHDHVIIGTDTSYYSFREHSLL